MTDGPAEALRERTKKKQEQLWGSSEGPRVVEAAWKQQPEVAAGQLGDVERAKKAVGSPEGDGRRHL